MEQNIYLSVRNLNKFFGKKQVIYDLSFDLHAGEILGFLGPNGAGKTTTIKMIMGFLSVDSGEIDIMHRNRTAEYEEAMSFIGGIVENPEMYGDLSGRLNLEMYRRLHENVPKERIDEVLQLVKMQNQAREKVKRYSLGMKQRMCIAQALLHKPKILILDEPTNGLDPAGIHELRDLLIYLAHKENLAILISSHQLTEIQKICDRVIIIDQGKLIDNQPINQLIRQSEKQFTLFTFYDQANADKALNILNLGDAGSVRRVAKDSLLLALEKEAIPEIIFKLSQAHIQIISVQPHQTNLEDFYLSVTGGGQGIA